MLYVVPVLNPNAYIKLGEHYSSNNEFIDIYKNLDQGDCEDELSNGININRNFEY